MKKTKKLSFLFLTLAVLFFLLGFSLNAFHRDLTELSQDQSNNERRQEPKDNEKLAREKEDKERKKFIVKIAPIAQEIQKEYHILPSITIAQACLESDWGRSSLSAKYNNYFGIKGGEGSDTIELKTKEFEDGHWIEKKAKFRVYRSLEESMEDHAKLLKNGTSWNNNQYQEVLKAQDYHEASEAMYRAGYATDPAYATKLIKIIEKYKLNQYDK